MEEYGNTFLSMYPALAFIIPLFTYYISQHSLVIGNRRNKEEFQSMSFQYTQSYKVRHMYAYTFVTYVQNIHAYMHK